MTTASSPESDFSQEDLENIMPLTELVEYLPSSVTLERLRRWADTDRKNGFPEPVEKLGKVKFYDKNKVVRWTTLWLKTQNSKQAFRGGKKDSNG